MLKIYSHKNPKFNPAWHLSYVDIIFTIAAILLVTFSNESDYSVLPYLISIIVANKAFDCFDYLSETKKLTFPDLKTLSTTIPIVTFEFIRLKFEINILCAIITAVYCLSLLYSLGKRVKAKQERLKAEQPATT